MRGIPCSISISSRASRRSVWDSLTIMPVAAVRRSSSSTVRPDSFYKSVARLAAAHSASLAGFALGAGSAARGHTRSDHLKGLIAARRAEFLSRFPGPPLYPQDVTRLAARAADRSSKSEEPIFDMAQRSIRDQKELANGALRFIAANHRHGANAARFFGHGCRAGGASRDDGRMQRTQPVAAVTIALVY